MTQCVHRKLRRGSVLNALQSGIPRLQLLWRWRPAVNELWLSRRCERAASVDVTSCICALFNTFATGTHAATDIATLPPVCFDCLQLQLPSACTCSTPMDVAQSDLPLADIDAWIKRLSWGLPALLAAAFVLYAALPVLRFLISDVPSLHVKGTIAGYTHAAWQCVMLLRAVWSQTCACSPSDQACICLVSLIAVTCDCADLAESIDTYKRQALLTT